MVIVLVSLYLPQTTWKQEGFTVKLLVVTKRTKKFQVKQLSKFWIGSSINIWAVALGKSHSF
jgi:hypothetical protein